MIESIKKDIESAKNKDELYNIKVKYLGKKGLITAMYKELKELAASAKAIKGDEINKLKTLFNDYYEAKEKIISNYAMDQKLKEEEIDLTLPAYNFKVGTLHPLTRIREELEDLFISMGFEVVDGPEVEETKYNFDLLNIDKMHPARDESDTFYINDFSLMRTHTSPVQARSMMANLEKKPFKIICPGKVYRRDDDDATHSHQFMQIEGLVVGEDISLSDLKGTLLKITEKMFGKNLEIRFRPSFFPFTEPSFEVDVECFNCLGKGCPICKNLGFIEILGSGMVHPNVLDACGFDSKKYTGFAFGAGIERIAMIKYGIKDIRNFYTSREEFLNKFDRVEGGK